MYHGLSGLRVTSWQVVTGSTVSKTTTVRRPASTYFGPERQDRRSSWSQGSLSHSHFPMAIQTLLSLVLCAALLVGKTQGALKCEAIQLKDEEAIGFPAVKFGRWDHRPPKTKCKAFLGSDDWPLEREWQTLNATLGGALLQPPLPATACYPGPSQDAEACAFLVNNASNSHFYIDDPVSVLTQWPQGETCLPARNATGSCTRGGFPQYVVNASTVKHVQAAVNFARNNNVRLIIK